MDFVVGLVQQIDSTLLFCVNRGVELGDLLHEAIIVVAALQELCNKILVNNLTLELDGGDALAVTKLEMLYEKGSTIKLIAATNARKFLINSVTL